MLLEVVFANEHPAAVPPATIANVVDPVPVPPPEVNVSAWLYGELLLDALNDKVTALCASLLTEIETGTVVVIA